MSHGDAANEVVTECRINRANAILMVGSNSQVNARGYPGFNVRRVVHPSFRGKPGKTGNTEMAVLTKPAKQNTSFE
jgi:hypothetical protein